MSKKSKKTKSPSIWTMEDLSDREHEFSIWAGAEDLRQFVGDGLNDAEDAIEAAREAQRHTGKNIVVAMDGHAIGVVTEFGNWEPWRWIRLENDSIEIYRDRKPWTHGRDKDRYAATDEEARGKALRRYLHADSRSPRITHEFLTDEEAATILHAHRCELREASYNTRKGWIADMLCSVRYRYDGHGDVEATEWTFAAWEEKEPEVESEDED